MRIVLPETISLLGKELSVSRKPLVDCYAEYKHDSNEILVDTKCPEHLVWGVLLHEITHAILTITGVAELLDEKLEEAICVSMENLGPIVQLVKVKK